MPLIFAIMLSFHEVQDSSVAADHMIPVMRNGNAERELVKRYKVSAYPILPPLDTQEQKLERAVGYRSVVEMAKFLKTTR